VLDDTDPRFPRWFVDGETNLCYNAIDANIDRGLGDKPAFHYVSVYTGREETITFKELRDKVGRMASVMKK